MTVNHSPPPSKAGLLGPVIRVIEVDASDAPPAAAGDEEE